MNMTEKTFLLGTAVDIKSASGMFKEGIDVEVVTWDEPICMKNLLTREFSGNEWWVLCFQDEATLNFAKEILMVELAVCIEKVFDLSTFIRAITPLATVDRVMKNPINKEYSGMILGISHAEVGIIPELLTGCFCNLAVSSQDIYYNYITLQYCYSHYYEKIRNLDTLIIDLFDYTYFNYDVSLSRTALSYYQECGGISFDEHNFAKNKLFPENLQTYKDYFWLNSYKEITNEKIDFYEKAFGDVFAEANYKSLANQPQVYLRNNIVEEQISINHDIHKSIVVKEFDDTIKENIELLERLVNFAYSINPNMRICFVLLPKHYIVQEKMNVDPYFVNWKKRFNSIIDDFLRKYPIEMYDLENHEIGKKSHLYQDPTHLNYAGAIEFSCELDKLLNL